MFTLFEFSLDFAVTAMIPTIAIANTAIVIVPNSGIREFLIMTHKNSLKFQKLKLVCF